MNSPDDQEPAATQGQLGQITQVLADEIAEVKATPGERTRPESARSRAWLTKNIEALADSNRFVERHGLPLEQYRNF